MADFLNLSNKIRLEIVNTNVVIEDLDIDFEINLNEDGTPSTAKVTIWNLSEATKNLLKNKGTGVKLYYSEGDENLRLIFEGEKKNKVNTKKKGKKGGKKSKKDPRAFAVESEGGDVATVIELAETYKTYLDSFFSKSYKTEVNTNKVIADIAGGMDNSDSGFAYEISANVSPKTYTNGVSFHDHSKNVLHNICSNIGAKHQIINGIIKVYAVNEKPLNTVYTFNSQNIDTPEFKDDNELEFKTKLFTYVRPNNWINISTKNVNGAYKIKKMVHKGSNYSAINETEITVKEK